MSKLLKNRLPKNKIETSRHVEVFDDIAQVNVVNSIFYGAADSDRSTSGKFTGNSGEFSGAGASGTWDDSDNVSSDTSSD